MEQLFFFAIALSLAYGVGCLGKKRKIGFWMAFWLSALNIIIGLIAVLSSPKVKHTNS